jgi:hypothetical protein
MECAPISELKNFEEDGKWFHDNLNSFKVQKYLNKFIAIKNKKIVTSETNLDNLIKNLIKMGENPSYLFIEFVYPQGTVILL